jgi:hypothetical protein
MTNQEEVKPCPFCGEAITGPDDEGWYSHISNNCILAYYEFFSDELNCWNQCIRSCSQDVARVALAPAAELDAITIADSPIFGGIGGARGISEEVAHAAFYNGAPVVEVYIGRRIVFGNMAAFLEWKSGTAAPVPAEPKGEQQNIDAKEFAALQGWLQTNAKSWRLHGAGLAAWALTALERLHAKPERRAAACPRCASTTAQGCNDLNCGYLESERRAATLTDHMFGMFLRHIPKRLSDDAQDRAALRRACEYLLAANNGGSNAD